MSDKMGAIYMEETRIAYVNLTANAMGGDQQGTEACACMCRW
jgi:hypothetical protein